MNPREELGTLVRRALAAPFEVRAASDAELIVTGYASVFDAPYEMYGGPDAGGWTETVDRKAFDKTMSEIPDVPLLINHDGMPLARTKSKTLTIAPDDHGLGIRASLDRSNPQVQSLESAMHRKDMDEMSFAFRTIRDKWTTAAGKETNWKDPEGVNRSLTELNIHKGDVSIVNYGANPATSVSIARALEALAHGADDDAVLAEMRSCGVDLSAAQRALSRALRVGKPQTLSLAEALKLQER